MPASGGKARNDRSGAAAAVGSMGGPSAPGSAGPSGYTREGSAAPAPSGGREDYGNLESPSLHMLGDAALSSRGFEMDRDTVGSKRRRRSSGVNIMV
jgi:hypothetical protein